MQIDFSGTPENEDFKKSIRVRLELEKESDRGAAIIAGSYAELALENAIKSVLKNRQIKKDVALFDRLFDGYAPFATFSAKIDLSCALGLLSEKDYGDLHIIRAIRNAFAHDLDAGAPEDGLTFQSQSVADRCKNLWRPTTESPIAREQQKLDEPRRQYCYTVFRIAGFVRIMAEQVRLETTNETIANWVKWP